MAHQRKLIRQAVVLRIKNAATAAGDRVTVTFEPQRSARLASITLYTPDEETDPEDAQTAPRQLWRNLVLEICGWVIDTAAVPVADAMDNIAEQIEAAMAADRYFGGAVLDSILTTTQMATLGDQGADPLIGLIKLTYQVTYQTDADSIGILVEYLRTGVTTQIAGAGADNVVTDLLNQRP